MALVINTNIMSLDAQRNLAASTNNLAKSVERLSSGLRINSAADDAAGLAISNKLTAQTRSIAVAVRNAQDGVSMAQTTDGSLGKIGDILTRMRELAEESANGSLSDSDRSALNNEYTQMKNEIDRISNVTEFNGIKLLNGSLSTTGVTLQVGFHNTGNDTINFFSGVAATNTANLTVSATDVSTAAAAQTALGSIDSAINIVSQDRGTLGAVENRLDITISNLQTASENLTAANSRIKDADFAHETALFTQNQVIVHAGTAILAQANALPQNALTLLR